MALARFDEYDERFSLTNPAIAIAITAVLFELGKRLALLIAHDIAEQDAHIANHPRVETPEGEIISYSPHSHTGTTRDSYIPAQTAQCVATQRVLDGTSRVGMFKHHVGNTTTSIAVVDDPIIAASACFHSRVEASEMAAENKTKLIAAFDAALAEHLTRIVSTENRKTLANYINKLTIDIRLGKPRQYSHFARQHGDGFAHYSGPAYFTGSSTVTLFAGHPYTDTHITQIAKNLVNRFVRLLPKELTSVTTHATANQTRHARRDQMRRERR